jgi:hypothetical protein
LTVAGAFAPSVHRGWPTPGVVPDPVPYVTTTNALVKATHWVVAASPVPPGPGPEADAGLPTGRTECRGGPRGGNPLHVR